MKVVLLMNLEGAITGKCGDIVSVDNETALMLMNFLLVEKYMPPSRPKRKPIIVHTRSSKCINEQK